MANPSIKLFDMTDKKERVYDYMSNATIGDLRRSIAQKERYDSPEKVKIFLACIQLTEDMYIKDIIDLEEHGFFIEFENYTSATANAEIYVWAGKDNCTKLYPGVPETIEVRRNGNFGVARTRFVFQNTFMYRSCQTLKSIHIQVESKKIFCSCVPSQTELDPQN